MSDLFPLPEIDEINAPFWDGLKGGKLVFQECNSCGHHWLPARQECPSCLVSDYEWKSASGKGIMTSWVVYHTAFIPAFKDRLPYNVAIIKLDEGPQLASNIVGEVDQSKFMIDHPVELTIEDEHGVKVPRFKLV